MAHRFTPAKAVLLSMAIASANAALAQEEEDIEEVVVTGSFIRNSQFTNASPIDVITTDQIWDSGAANLGEYIRDLPYMENIDIVANTFDAQDGQQDSNSARFNFRGLGTESTLTLMDGTRTVNAGAVASLLPSIAQRSIELVYDGAAALYGADAVAGVVNIIPYKEYQGLKVRTYYKRDEPGDTEQSTLELMTGASWGSFSWVGAFEYRTRTALTVAERPKYLAISDQDTTSYNPGTWTVGFRTQRDPSCGEFNEGNEDLGQIGSLPSGEPGLLFGFLATCGGSFGEWQDFARPSENYTLYNSLTWTPSDWLELNFQMSHNYRESQLVTSPSSGQATANRGLITVPADHPANPFGRSVTPRSWRPYAKAGTQPGRLESNGFARIPYPYYTDSYRLSAEYEIADTSWRGVSYAGYQQYRRRTNGFYWSIDRINQALQGQGGPSGNETYNPFGSADPRSPYYEAGVTDNSPELLDWLTVDNYYETNRNRLKFFETIFDGDVFEIPTGMIRGAFGFQFRHVRDWDFNNPATLSRDNVATDTQVVVPDITDRDSGVRSAFVQLEVPLLTDSAIGSVGLNVAGRYEDFYTLGYETTKPKVSLLWQLTDTFALRTSYGESFLAPSPSQLRPALQENCVEIPDDDPDPITGLSMEGQPSCVSGNPNLNAEESEIWNVGFTWEPIDNLSISIDYQEIEFYDKIQTLISDEVTQVQYFDFLAATSYTAETYDTSNPDHVADGIAWVQANPSPLVARAADGSVEAIIRAPVNYAIQWVDLFDVRARYSWEMGDLGRFSMSLGGNYYRNWEYQQSPTAPIIDAKGISNSTSAFAPPIAKWKANLGLTWIRGNHAASITGRYIDEMEYDENTLTAGYSLEDYPYIRAIARADARYSYRFSDWFGAGGNLTVGVTNMFDREPQRLPQRNGMESRIDDPFGRQYYLSLDFDLDTPWN